MSLSTKQKDLAHLRRAKRGGEERDGPICLGSNYISDSEGALELINLQLSFHTEEITSCRPTFPYPLNYIHDNKALESYIVSILAGEGQAVDKTLPKTFSDLLIGY